MTVMDLALAVLASLVLTALLTRLAKHWLAMPCRCEPDEHERGGQ